MEAQVKVVGVTFKNDEDGVARQALLGTLYDDYWTEGLEDQVRLMLRREPDNPYDKNAVGVWCEAPEACAGRLGFLPGDEAPEFGERLEAGEVQAVEIDDMGAVRNKVWLRLSVQFRDPASAVEDDEGRLFEFD